MSRAGTIDGLLFSREREVLSGTLDLSALPRLAESGCAAAAIQYSLRGGENDQGCPCLDVAVVGRVSVQCRRCLGAVELALDLHNRLELAATEQEIATADDEIDRVLAGRAMDVAALVEDEVLLALPMAPAHERCAALAFEADARASAFAGLAGLRKGGTD